MKTYIVILIYATGILFAIALFLSWHFSSTIVYPRKIDSPFDASDAISHPREARLPYEEVSFNSFDDTKIYAWFIQNIKKAPAIIFVHGFGGDRLAGLSYAPALHRLGFNLLFIDLRNHGKSKTSKTKTGFGYYEKHDIRAAVKFLEKKKLVSSIGVFGFSMGSSSSILAMAEDNKIKAGIFEGGYTNFTDIIAYRAKYDFYLPKFPIVPYLSFLFEMRSGAKVAGTSAIDAISKISPRPVFIIHATKDNKVPVSHGIALYESANEPREIWMPESKNHIDSWFSHREEAIKRVGNFFKKHL